MKIDVCQKFVAYCRNKIGQNSSAIFRKWCWSPVNFRTRIATATVIHMPMYVPIAIWIYSIIGSQIAAVRFLGLPPQSLLQHVQDSCKMCKGARYLCECVSVSIRIYNGKEVPVEGACYVSNCCVGAGD